MTLDFFNDLLNADSRKVEEVSKDEFVQQKTQTQQIRVFDITEFERELFVNSANNNREQQQYSTSVNAYDLMGCIRAALFKYFKIPVKSFANKWLPILMRSSIGRAIHSFIQKNTQQFTETEVYVKVPSLHFSGRVDAVINNDVLVEIKSCTYTDYKTIINSKRPRVKDFYQTVIYKYFLENYCDEIKKYCKNRKIVYGNVPKQDKYDFVNIQYIYVAHDIVSADASSISEALKVMKEVKRQLNSKYNRFFFITSLVINSQNDIIKDALLHVVDRIKEFNSFIEANKIPPLDHKYVNKSDCYFCIYKDVCERY